MKKFLKAILFLCALSSLAYAEEAVPVVTSGTTMSAEECYKKYGRFELKDDGIVFSSNTHEGFKVDSKGYITAFNDYGAYYLDE